jgi:hypothetical protein
MEPVVVNRLSALMRGLLVVAAAVVLNRELPRGQRAEEAAAVE